MRDIAIALALILPLAACAGGVSGGGSGLPETQMTQATGDIVPPARGYLGVPVRSFVSDPEAASGWLEVSGARCAMSAGAYRASLVTPGRLVLPDLGPDAPDIRADCALGEASGSVLARADYSWPTGERPSAPTRTWYGAGWWFGYEKTGPVGYPDISVGLR